MKDILYGQATPKDDFTHKPFYDTLYPQLQRSVIGGSIGQVFDLDGIIEMINRGEYSQAVDKMESQAIEQSSQKNEIFSAEVGSR